MGEPYQPQKLYWSVFPRGMLKFFVRVLPLVGRDPTKFGRNGDIDLREIVEHDYPPTTRIDVWPYYDIKQAGVGVPHQPDLQRAGPIQSVPTFHSTPSAGLRAFSTRGTQRRRIASDRTRPI